MKRRSKKKRGRARLVFALVALLCVAFAGLYAAQGGSWSWLVVGAQDASRHAFVDGPPTDGEIRVFFAPTSPANPSGIDDHLIALIRGARESIHAAFYDLELESIAAALIDRHRMGVKVGIVSDSHYENRDAVQACVRAGIPVVFDKRSAFMHNKFCVVDNLWVWTGSTNATYNCMYRNNNNAVLIAAKPLAENYTAEFLEMHRDRRFGARSPRNTPTPMFTLGPVVVECYFAPEDGVEKEILAEIAVARSTIDFMAFSFTSEPIAKAMAARIGAGVRVRGLFETRNAADRYSRDDFLAARGAEIHLDRNSYNMHHKVIIIDVATVVTGSYNFSRNAENQNDENVLILHCPDIARRYTDEFEALIAP
ncbi:MAG TPA: phospholipase D-like domain-containing protein [Candidatus Hydrogenedentes bacterium]|nr:phospholipase D-like domain-containing protein [Candidatus Hydrogenedentota bacterium]